MPPKDFKAQFKALFLSRAPPLVPCDADRKDLQAIDDLLGTLRNTRVAEAEIRNVLNGIANFFNNNPEFLDQLSMLSVSRFYDIYAHSTSTEWPRLIGSTLLWTYFIGATMTSLRIPAIPKLSTSSYLPNSPSMDTEELKWLHLCGMPAQPPTKTLSNSSRG